ncbi:MAG TPA: GNAT family protein [Bacteroidia bacterium]|nr:GNAT family protein [Bacteroidia bacterium]
MSNLSVREITQSDIPFLCKYWLNSDHDFMRGMGVDISKIPTHEAFTAMLTEQLTQSYEEKKTYCMIWEVDGVPVGHSNVNKIIFGKEAFMHLHIWQNGGRKKGTGTAFVKMTIPWFFKNLRLEKLYCEPYSLNPAPNRTLEKVGFTFVKSYTCIPGWLNFEQEVNLWEIAAEQV